MPHCDIQHPETKKWRCYSTIVDDWISNWLSEKDYKEWKTYYDNYDEERDGPITQSKLYSFEEIAYDFALKKLYCNRCNDLDKCNDCVYNINLETYKKEGHAYLGNFMKLDMEDYPYMEDE